jgi:hypothetical protein
MIGEKIEEVIKNTVSSILQDGERPKLPNDIIQTDNLGEVIEKLVILHIRTWMLEDAIGVAKTDSDIAGLKRKVDICFKQKRPKYVEGINRMVTNTIINGESLDEDSVKLYKGHED